MLYVTAIFKECGGSGLILLCDVCRPFLSQRMEFDKAPRSYKVQEDQICVVSSLRFKLYMSSCVLEVG